MNGAVITGTPIAVDFWRWRQCPNSKVFFLSHGHSDHTSGLTCTWREPIYCSEVTGRIAVSKCGVKESLIRTLTVGESHIIRLDDMGKETMTVTLFDANHCPGATMFLFEGYFGRILYTGDFRFQPSMFSNLLIGHGRIIDRLYLDNTYNSVSCDFPSEIDCKMKIMEILASSPYKDIVIGMHQLGKEDLLEDIAKFFEEDIQVWPERLSMINLLDCEDVFTSQERRIRVVPVHTISRTVVEQWQSEIPTIVIIPSAIFEAHRKSKLTSLQDVYLVPYSSHSSYSELIKFVQQVKPRKVIPIVNPSASKGKECDISDVSNFRPFLDTTPAAKVVIPPSVEKYMMSASSQCPVRIPSLKRKHSSSSTIAKGVVFEDVDDDEMDTEKLSEKCEILEDTRMPRTSAADNYQKGDRSHRTVNGTPSKSQISQQDVPKEPQMSRIKVKKSNDSATKAQGTIKVDVCENRADSALVTERISEKGDRDQNISLPIKMASDNNCQISDSDCVIDVTSTAENTCRSVPKVPRQSPRAKKHSRVSLCEKATKSDKAEHRTKRKTITDYFKKHPDYACDIPSKFESSTPRKAVDGDSQIKHGTYVDDTPSKSRKSPSIKLKKLCCENSTQLVVTENRTFPIRTDFQKYSNDNVSDSFSPAERITQSSPKERRKSPRKVHKKLCSCDITSNSIETSSKSGSLHEGKCENIDISFSDHSNREIPTGSKRTTCTNHSPASRNNNGTSFGTACESTGSTRKHLEGQVQRPVTIRQMDFRMNCYRAMKKFFDRVKANEMT